MCWFPKKPGSLRIAREDFTHIVRCGDCPGCIELDRRRLADRLVARYPERDRSFWVVRIYASIARHAKLSRLLHRRVGLALEPGFARLGVSSFAVIAQSKAPIAAALRDLGLPHRAERVQLSRGRRAWRRLTAGLLVSRERYGEQVKRWYFPGLPPAPREKFEVVSKPYKRGYARASSPRAWTASKVILVPPAVWSLRRADRRRVREALRNAPDPESASVVIDLVAAVSTKLAAQLNVNAAPKERLSKEQVQAWYQRMAERRAASSSSDSGSEDLPPFSEMGGYRSSVHTTSADAPKLLSDEELLSTGKTGDPVWMERERESQRLRGQRETATKARNQSWIEQWSERMKRLVKGGKPDG